MCINDLEKSGLELDGKRSIIGSIKTDTAGLSDHAISPPGRDSSLLGTSVAAAASVPRSGVLTINDGSQVRATSSTGA